MKKIFCFLLIVCNDSLIAQNVGINTSTPKARLQVNGGLSVIGTLNTADSVNTFVTGPVMFFNPYTAAFRAGYAGGTEWINSKTGFGSAAFGEGTKAAGAFSLAGGYNATANGSGSLAVGIASTADADASVALGSGTKASSAFSFACGLQVQAKSYMSFVMGRFNDTTGSSSTSWVDADPLFMIGNGTANNARSNALTVLKDGRVGIGTNNPLAKLQLNQAGNYAVAEGNGHAFEIRDMGVSNTNFLYMGADNTNGVGYIQSTKTGSFQPLALNARGGNVGIGLINPSQKLDVNGSGKFSGDIIVQNDKGIIRSSTGVQQKLITFAAPFTFTINPGLSFTNPVGYESFSSAPVIHIGNVSGTGDIGKVLVTITSAGTSGCTVNLYNPSSLPISFNGIFNFIAVGQQ